MSAILTIDPGYAKRGRGCALAVTSPDGYLQRAWFERPEEWHPRQARSLADHFARVVVEEPQWDDRSKGIDPRVLLRLTREGFTLGAYYAAQAGVLVEGITPSAWKGSVPKPVQHSEMLDAIHAGRDMPAWNQAQWDAIRYHVDAACERGALERWKRPGAEYYPSNWDMHNLLDAMCMAMKLNGRMP